MAQKGIDTLKEDFKRADFQGHILETLIYFASYMGRKKIPTIEQFILSEVVAATIEYLTGKEYLFTYHRMKDGKEYITVADNWEWETNKAMAEALEQSGEKLNVSLKEALKELTEIKTSHDDCGDVGYDSWLYTWYKHEICHIWMISTFSISVEFITKVKREIIPSLDSNTLNHCKAIARLMKKYIKRDMELIGKRYHW